MVKLDYAVQILQTGLAGFAFLLAYLSYQLISREQKKEQPRDTILRSARNYFLMCIVLALVVGGFQLTRYLLGQADELSLSECRDSFEILLSRQERAATIDDMRAAINEHIGICGGLIKDMDKAE